MRSCPPDFRRQFEGWWAEFVAEGERQKNPYFVDVALRRRLRAMSPGAPERAWVGVIMLDWLASSDDLRWHFALSHVCDQRVPAGPAALRAAARNASTESKRGFAETFLRVALRLEQELTVPERFRAEFDGWWDERIAAATDDERLSTAAQLLAARVDALTHDAPERAWIEQLLIERVGSLDMRVAQPALAFVREHRIAGAIPEIRRNVGWNRTAEMVAVERQVLDAADDIAEAAGYPGARAGTAGGAAAAATVATAKVDALEELAALPIWSSGRLRPSQVGWATPRAATSKAGTTSSRPSGARRLARSRLSAPFADGSPTATRLSGDGSLRSCPAG